MGTGKEKEKGKNIVEQQKKWWKWRKKRARQGALPAAFFFSFLFFFFWGTLHWSHRCSFIYSPLNAGGEINSVLFVPQRKRERERERERSLNKKKKPSKPATGGPGFFCRGRFLFILFFFVFGERVGRVERENFLLITWYKSGCLCWWQSSSSSLLLLLLLLLLFGERWTKEIDLKKGLGLLLLLLLLLLLFPPFCRFVSLSLSLIVGYRVVYLVMARYHRLDGCRPRIGLVFHFGRRWSVGFLFFF